MLDFFVILSRGGIVLWYIKNTTECIKTTINTFLKSLILKENIGNAAFVHESFALKHLMDNEFDLLFIAGYQQVLQLSYVDKFLTMIALEFRDKYKNDLLEKNLYGYFEGFRSCFDSNLRAVEEESRRSSRPAKSMRTFADSEKSKKTIASMIVNKDKQGANSTDKPSVIHRSTPPPLSESNVDHSLQPKKVNLLSPKARMAKSRKLKESSTPSDSPTCPKPGKKGKVNRRWTNEATGAEAAALDYSAGATSNGVSESENQNGGDKVIGQGLRLTASEAESLAKLRGTLQEGFDQLEVSSDENEEDEIPSFEEDGQSLTRPHAENGTTKSSGFLSGLIQNLKTTATGRVLTHEDIKKPLEQLRDHLVHKNVAYEIANRLCDGVAERLVGVQLGRFERVGPRVRAALEEACTRLLASGRRVDVLRDALEAQQSRKPYVIVFCGVNGVGKSTNLAKIAFWLIEKNLKVLIAACDTFRSGAVEQLRTHVQKLNFIHPPERHDGHTMVELFEKGYGKDAASIAMSAVSYAKDRHLDVVLVDTAGRMQDNEPLMRSLAKLIIVNEPDLVLFVGEALVGNEAIDQLVKFNQSLADFSSTAKPHTIDGIVLTKFDTIDDKVGAAVSMAHISGQPIVFVGTGQTYSDLRQFSVASVVKALMK
uniref:SRP54 domain-containing protein n=1 Tax=Mesocestoides corti TaxID=53468 RepID=A0A5K3EM39_MESCO